MTKIRVVDRSNTIHHIGGFGAQTLMEAIRDAGIDDMLALCGGCCSCSTCHVYIDADHYAGLPKPEEIETELLDGLDARCPTSRLACQIELAGIGNGLAVVIAPGE